MDKQAKVRDFEKIDQLVYKLYDLTCLRAYTHRQAPEEIAIVEGEEVKYQS